MRILIAAPLRASQIGGPALYAEGLTNAFRSLGHAVTIHSFSTGLPSGIRHLVYLLGLLPHVMRAHIVFTLDYTSVGFPVALACALLGRPFFVRVGGDIWEFWAARTRKSVPLPEFYRGDFELSLKDRMLRTVARFVFLRARKIIFSTSWQRDIIATTYGISEDATAVVSNFFPPRQTPASPTCKEFLWAGRMIFIKNLEALIEAFSLFNRAAPSHGFTLRLIGDGPDRPRIERLIQKKKLADLIRLERTKPREELLEDIAHAYCLVLPSLSDVSPNILADAISAGVPFISTKHLGWPDNLENSGIVIDPLDANEIAQAMSAMIEPGIRERFSRATQAIDRHRPWGLVAGQYLRVFSS